MDKRASRIRRAAKTRARIRLGGRPRLSVFRTPQHIYAQVFTPDGGQVLCAASSVEKDLKAQVNGATGNCTAAEAVGVLLAQRCQEKQISQVAFDRSGYPYHGRVKALAEAARSNGLDF